MGARWLPRTEEVPEDGSGDDLGAGVGQATVFGKGSKTGVTLLPASVYSQVLSLRKATQRTLEGTWTERWSGEDEPVFRSRKTRNGLAGHLESLARG